MPRMKYDWQKIKQDFMTSDYKEVKVFFTDNYGNYNGVVRTNTAGWTKEKKELKEQGVRESLEELKKKDKEERMKVFANINQSRKIGLNKLAKDIVKKSTDEEIEINYKEFTEILKHFRLEMGETTDKVDLSGKIENVITEGIEKLRKRVSKGK